MPLTPASVVHQATLKENPNRFPSRRSVVHSTKGIVACTQPLAAKCGLKVLDAGGNAADAAVAVAAALNVTEPCSTGIGGDMFCLYYSDDDGKVSALNGSGRSGAACSLERIRSDLGLAGDRDDSKQIPMSSVHAVTVPGAAAGWADTVERFGSGKLSLAEILEPAAVLAEEGFPVSELTSIYWQLSERSLRAASPNYAEVLKRDPAAPDGVRAPAAGEIMRNPTLAQTFRTLGSEGKKGFYTGRIASEIISAVKSLGGHLELGDLEHHLEAGSEPVEPISLRFTGFGITKPSSSAPGDPAAYPLRDGIDVWEHPPNGQGLVALMALGILQELETSGKIPTFGAADFNTTPYLHAIIEALKIAFADGAWFISDPSTGRVPVPGLLDKAYLRQRGEAIFSATAASRGSALGHGSPAMQSSDTVYFAVSDSEGNACSFINSNYGGFGTGIVPRGCGFTLQNRGANFSLQEGHPNVLAPRKRPYHTIIPAAATLPADKGALHSVFGVMGGFMQPQGHVQVLLGQLVGGLSPQEALDAPRICIGDGWAAGGEGAEQPVYVEEGMDEEVVKGLAVLGHKVKVVKGFQRAMFGRGQIIRWTVDGVEGKGVWSAGSDMRGDGAAYPA